jgi:hypothetical protein
VEATEIAEETGQHGATEQRSTNGGATSVAGQFAN